MNTKLATLEMAIQLKLQDELEFHHETFENSKSKILNFEDGALIKVDQKLTGAL